MTRKNYIALAGVIKEQYEAGTIQPCAIDKIGDVLYEDNPRFDWNRFAEACGLGGDEVMSCAHLWLRHSRASIVYTRAGVQAEDVREWTECAHCGLIEEQQ